MTTRHLASKPDPRQSLDPNATFGLIKASDVRKELYNLLNSTSDPSVVSLIYRNKGISGLGHVFDGYDVCQETKGQFMTIVFNSFVVYDD